MKLFHGSNAKFLQFSQNKARMINDFYGGGVAYFTSSFDVALDYATGMKKRKGGRITLYTVDYKPKKIFDVDHVFKGKELTNILPSDLDTFGRGANILKLGSNKFQILNKLSKGQMNMTGDQIFKGLSKGQQTTAKAREYLKSQGYDALRYNGGINMGMKRHDVYVAYYANQIKIKSTQQEIIKQ